MMEALTGQELENMLSLPDMEAVQLVSHLITKLPTTILNTTISEIHQDTACLCMVIILESTGMLPGCHALITVVPIQ